MCDTLKPSVMNRAIIIVAGGKGLRMGSELPKQFLPLGGKPVLMRTMEAFRAYDAQMQQILVLPADQQDFWRQLCTEHRFDLEHRLACGGATRFESVKNGLQQVPDDAWVGIHDGVRPFVSTDTIARCYEAVLLHRAVIPVVDVVDSLRHCRGGNSQAVDRAEYRLVQTPQVFHAGLLKQAYEQPYSTVFTDDASVVEALGVAIHHVEGNRENIKITTPFDLKIGEALL